jgi:hypothetical protein
MFRKLFSILMAFLLIVATLGDGSPAFAAPFDRASEAVETQTLAQASQPSRLPDGIYPVQQASYDDGDGSYTLMLLDTAPGESSVFRTTNLPMARLTDEETEAGQKSYLKVEKGQPSLHLSEDFRIEYVHNVTETQVNPQTGEREVVVVRQEPSFWTPFAGALAGQAIGRLLFTPHYYFPPAYQPGVPLTGYGSYGRTYGQAVQQYQTRYQAPPAEVRNRQFRTTGRLRSPGFGSSGSSARRATKTPGGVTTTARPRTPKATSRPSGSGYGTSTLRRSPSSSTMRKPSRSFGSRSGGMRGGMRARRR